MAKIIIAGNSILVKSSRTMEELKNIEKYRPKALCLYDENGNVTYRVGTTKGEGSVSACGVSFGVDSKDKEKKACVTITVPENRNDAIAYAEETIGTSILKLNEVEAGLDKAVKEIEADRAAVRATITEMA